MKIARLLAGAAIIVASLSTAEARASEVDFTPTPAGFGSAYYAGEIEAGQYGNINGGGYIEGDLGPNTEAVFNYTYNPTLGDADYNYAPADTSEVSSDIGTVNGDEEDILASAGDTIVGPPAGASTVYSTRFEPATSSYAGLVFATASLSGGQNGLENGAIMVENETSGSLAFEAALISSDPDAHGSYSVSSVSAVPLPASFPMFAAVLASLAGFSVYRKRRML